MEKQEGGSQERSSQEEVERTLDSLPDKSLRKMLAANKKFLEKTKPEVDRLQEQNEVIEAILAKREKEQQ